MGYAFKGVCYTTQPEAANQYCQSLSQSSTNSSGQVVIHNCTSYTATQATISKLINTTTTTQVVTLPTFQNCTYDGAFLITDYFLLGLGVLIGIWAQKQVLNLFSKNTTPV